MPPPPSIISRQFTPVESEGRTLMVLCNHCQQSRVPRNSLVRKENHLRACQAYQLSAAALQQREQHQQQQQQQAQQALPQPSPVVIDTNAANHHHHQQQQQQQQHHDVVFGATSSAGDDSSISNNIPSNTISSNVNDCSGFINGVLPLNLLEKSISNRVIRSKPGNTKDSISARYNGASPTNLLGHRSTGPASVADDIYSGMPYTYPLAYPQEQQQQQQPNSLRSLMAAEESRKRKRGAASPGLPNETASPERDVLRAPGAKRLKYAEFYLDEEDFEFVCHATTPREEKFREIVERLARLVRLRDTRGS